MVDVEIYRCVKSFCYMGHILDGDGGEDLVVIARIRKGFCSERFYHLWYPELSPPPPPLVRHGRVYASYVRSSMTYGSDARPLLADGELKFDRAEMQMNRWMWGVSMKYRKTSDELKKMVGVEPITTYKCH